MFAEKSPLRLRVHIDGGARGNPGPAAAAFVVRDASDGVVIHEKGLYLGRATNNVAEYRGLLAALDYALAVGADEVEVLSDSQLLVKQMNGQYRVKSEGLKPLHEKALALCGRFASCTFRHVPRRENPDADRLVNRAINLKRNVDSTVG